MEETKKYFEKMDKKVKRLKWALYLNSALTAGLIATGAIGCNEIKKTRQTLERIFPKRIIECNSPQIRKANLINYDCEEIKYFKN